MSRNFRPNQGAISVFHTNDNPGEWEFWGWAADLDEAKTIREQLRDEGLRVLWGMQHSEGEDD